RIADITRQTNSATQDAASSVSYLAELAEQLRASVAAFRLPERSPDGAAAPLRGGGAFPPLLNLPDLGAPAWGGQEYPLPALPPASSAPAPFGGYYGAGGDMTQQGGYPGFPADSSQPGYFGVPGMDPDPQYSSGPLGSPQFPGDHY
ncbi:MAG TPA: hypothetical protein VF916_07165, partial [Ktedonobacterales bacterium]